MRGLGCNCNNQMGRVIRRPRLGAAPSWWDNTYNEVSSAAENVWNDVESAGVWAENQATGLYNDIANPGAIPGNPIQQGYQAGQSTRQAVVSGVQGIAGAVEMPFLIIGGGILILFALLEQK